MNNEVQKYYDMIREFYYEKNGLKCSIEFLELMLEKLKKQQEK